MQCLAPNSFAAVRLLAPARRAGALAVDPYDDAPTAQRPAQGSVASV